MKHYFKYITTMVALLAMTVGTWASTVTINVLPSQLPAAPGTVTQSISEGVCTLTVTPASGYTCSLENVHVELTVNGNLAQAPRRSPNINNVVVTALTPDADPSGETKYTFEFPDATYDAEVTVEFQKIALYVGGVGVTSYNASRITGTNISGIVSFNTANNTLTLNGATIDMSTAESGFPIESSIDSLNVYLIGSNTLKPNAMSAYGFGYTNAANEGDLNFIHQDSPGKNGYGSLTVVGGNVALGYNIVNDFPESQTVTGWRQTGGTNPTITYVEYYNLFIGDTQVISTGLTLSDGKVFFNPVTNTLSLNNYTTSEIITSGLSELTVALTGVNEVGKIKFSNVQQLPAAGTITICKAANSNADLNKLTATIEDFGSVTVVEPLHDIQPNVFSDVVGYNLYINGTRVNSENKNTIGDGISFDATTSTLTLNKVNTTLQKGAFIENGLDKLTINLLGKNTIACGGFKFLVAEDENDHEVIFTTSPNAAGSLTMTINKDVEWYSGHSTSYQNNLKYKTEESENTLTITIAAPSEFYGLKIGGTEVTNMNASNIMAGVSYDATFNTLTLNAATIPGNIETSRSELNVYLIGTSTMTGGFTLAEGCANGKLKIASHGEAEDKLQMGVAYGEGIDVEYSNKLELNGLTISLPADYGITIAGTTGKLITPENRTDVLNDGGTVAFDGNAKLILTDATINGKIVVTPDAQLPAEGLTIELVGHSKITNDNGVAVEYTGGNPLKVTFITVRNESVSLVYTDTNDDPLAGAPTLASAFKKCGVSFNDVLSSKENTTAKTVTIGLTLELIVTETNPVAVSTFNEVMDETTSTNNTIIDGWQYNMGANESADPENVGGFNQETGKVTFTEQSVMNEDDITPGNENVIGITTMIGSGEHIIDLIQADIKIGYNIIARVNNITVFSVRDMLKKEPGQTGNIVGRDFSFNVLTVEPSFVQIAVIKDDNSGATTPAPAPAMKPGHHIGPKASVTGALGGLKVTNNNMQTSEPPAMTYKAMEMSAVAAGMSAIGNALNGYTCTDPDITDLPDNMFVDNTPSPTPRRAGAVKTILPEGLTFVDFSNTKITGMEIDRTKGAFNGVPENVFIYMPAGNSVATGTKNVVIGGISENVELNGSIDALPFKAMKDFKAAQITLKRTFEGCTDENKIRATVYLPYDIPQADANLLGTFYEYESNNGSIVDMKSVTTGGLKANKPYIFEAKAGGVTDPTVHVVDVKANPVETEGFKGVYERKDYEPGMYCYAAENRGGYSIGQFVEMGPGSYVPPFRAYMIGDGAPSYAIAWDGIVEEFDNTTDVMTIDTKKTVANKKTSEGWWTMSGMRLTDMPKKAGLYIFNGKMVVVK